MDWLKSASINFSGTLTALAIFAIPMGWWLPREFDQLDSKVSENSVSLELIEVQVGEVLTISTETFKKVETALAETKSSSELIGYLAANLDEEKQVLNSLLASKIPAEVWAEWTADGKQQYLKASLVNGVKYIFVDKANLGKFSMADRAQLKSVSELSGYMLTYWDQNEFPGFDAMLSMPGFEAR